MEISGLYDIDEVKEHVDAILYDYFYPVPDVFRDGFE
jgi:hypothetical protein